MNDREAELRARLGERPDDAEALGELATIVLAARRRKAEAVELWKRYAAAVDPSRLSDATLGLARAQMEARQEEQAIESLQRCTELDPNAFDAFDLLGELLRRRGRLEEAAEALGRAVRLDPQALRPRLALVTCLDGLGRSDEAQTLLVEAEKLGEGDPAVRGLIQELLRRRG